MSNFDLLPPDVNVLNIRGPGSKPIRAAAAAWTDLAEKLSSATRQWICQVGDAESWFQGPAAESFSLAAARYSSWLQGHGNTASKTAEYLHRAANIYDETVEGMVPYTTIATNRVATLGLKTTNLLGQFTAKIAELDYEYQKMWAQNAKMMNTYQEAIFDIMGQAESEGIAPAPLVISSSSRRERRYY
ncbi:PPE family protein [Mycobacterium haemophilum]|uniref:PPE family protein n=1 Tax=Mycobacterium haemophilum TaxID=29311 RepID=UPI000ADC91B1|nr:PPE family protein [Mycobacterium haemophilum]MCV7340172.1 PPE family protein [Mycobacterium haemophilum DSM 44634]